MMQSKPKQQIIPARVMLIRHAEDATNKQDTGLSPAGKNRAYQIVNIFAPGGRLAGAQFYIATDRSKHSNRSCLTLAPLSFATHIPINHEWSDDEYAEVAKRVRSGQKYQGADVLICWHHGNLPALAHALGVSKSVLPWDKWPDDVYDIVWIIDYDIRGVATFRSEKQGV